MPSPAPRFFTLNLSATVSVDASSGLTVHEARDGTIAGFVDKEGFVYRPVVSFEKVHGGTEAKHKVCTDAESAAAGLEVQCYLTSRFDIDD